MSRSAILILCCIIFVVTVSPSAVAHGQVSHQMNLLGQVDAYPQYSDVWGFTDELGQEYALLGTNAGTSVINVTAPATAYETGFFPGPSSTWRDIKTFGDYAYVVTEGGGGMLILDLTDPENPTSAGSFVGFSSAHNIYIDVANARAYPCGTDVNGTQILDLTNPTAPLNIGNYTTRYVHDLYVRNNIGYMAEINDVAFSIVDLSDPVLPVDPVVLAGPQTYAGAKTHSTWLSDDGNTMFTTDEVLGGHLKIWDISAIPTISLVSEWSPPGLNTIIHNVTVLGNLAYASYYSEGIRVIDVGDPAKPSEVAWYDTYPGAPGAEGAWGVYPYLPSGNILVSDKISGLFILEVTLGDVRLSGVVTEDGAGNPLENATVEIVETGRAASTDASGEYVLFEDAGTYTVRVSKEGFETLEGPIVLQGLNGTFDAALVRLPSAVVGGEVNGFVGGSRVPLLGATVSLVGTGFAAQSAADGGYSLGLIPLGSYDLLVQRPGFHDATVPLLVQPETGAYLESLLHPVAWHDDAEADLGWTLADPADAPDGRWVRSVPAGDGVVYPSEDASPGDDGMAFVTGDSSFVIFGPATLTSPALSVGAMVDPHVRYSRWFKSGFLPFGPGVLEVQFSEDAGANWTTLETLTSDENEWVVVDFRVLDFFASPAAVHLRFRATIPLPLGYVEAAVDDIQVYEADLTATAAPVPVVSPWVLGPAAPNPFNPRTVFRLHLTRPDHVRFDVFDLMGRRVTTLVDEERPAGLHSVAWDGRDDQGALVASGGYLAVVDIRGHRSVRKVTLAK